MTALGAGGAAGREAEGQPLRAGARAFRRAAAAGRRWLRRRRRRWRGGSILGEEGAAEAESGRGQPEPGLPAELAREKKSEPGAGWEERGRGGGGGQGGREGVAAASGGGTRWPAPRGGGRGARRRAGPEHARGWGSAWLAPSPRLLAAWEPPAAARSRGQGGREAGWEKGKRGEGRGAKGMGDGLEGRRLTGLLTVKRKLPRNEFGLGGRCGVGCWSGGRRPVGPRAGCSGEGCRTDGRMGRLRRGSPLTGPRLRAANPFFSLF